jgi:voltage-gated potassium channel
MPSQLHNVPQLSLKARLVTPVATVVAVTIIGTVGYYILGQPQDATLLDALFMTVITITTIGYGEIIHLDETGRLFTILIALTGIGSLFYSLTVIMDNLVLIRVSDPFETKKMQRMIDAFDSHVIIAGLGRVGRQAAREMNDSGMPFVIIDNRVEAQAFAVQQGYLFILGDASDDQVLQQAGITRAKGLIVTSGDDATNVYIVLSARVLNPKLFIISRAVEESSIPKLTRAGADRAISPHAIGGRRLAHLILSPTVIDFFDTVISKGDECMNLEGIGVQLHSPVVGQCLGDLSLRERSGANVLVIFRGRQVIANPEDSLTLEVDDRILALGTTQQLKALESILLPG